MRCYQCGLEVPDGQDLCMDCAAKLEKTVRVNPAETMEENTVVKSQPEQAEMPAQEAAPEPEATEAIPKPEKAPEGDPMFSQAAFQLNLEGVTQDAPKKKNPKRKKLVIRIIAAVVALAMIVTGVLGFFVLDWGLYIRDFFERRKDPVEYKNIVEQRALENGGITEVNLLKRMLLNSYDDQLAFAQQGGITANVSLEMGDELRGILELALLTDPQSREILDSVESVDATVHIDVTDANMRYRLGLGANGCQVVTLDAVWNQEEGVLYLSVPEASETALTLTKEELGGDYQSIAMLFELADYNYQFCQSLPDKAALEQSIDGCMLEMLQQITDVERDPKATVEAGGVKQKVTELTYHITDETMQKMVMVLLERAETDEILNQLVTAYSDYLVNITTAMNRVDPEFTAFTGLTVEMLQQAQDTVEQEETSGETLLEIKTYVNRKGQIIGRSYEPVDGETDGELTYFVTNKMRKVGYCAQICVDGETLKLEGSGTWKKGKVDGKGSVTFEGDEYIVVELKDLDSKTFYGTISLSLGKELRAQLKEELSADMTTIVDVTKMTLDLIMAENSADIQFKIGSNNVLNIHADRSYQDAQAAVPEKKTGNLALWVVGMDLDAILENLQKTGLHESITDVIYEGLSELVSDYLVEQVL